METIDAPRVVVEKWTGLKALPNFWRALDELFFYQSARTDRVGFGQPNDVGNQPFGSWCSDADRLQRKQHAPG
jgi:hypothetical protein